MRRLKFLVLLALLEISACDEGGFFTVVGSNLIKFREKYRASVVYTGYEKDSKLTLKLRHREADRNDTTYEVAKEVTLSGSGVQNVDFDLKDQPEGKFVLEVIGDNFTSYKKLNINDKRSSTFVQTDKATYKPSDLVQFRVLMVDAETRPLELPPPSRLEIFITDGGENRVKQFDGAKLERGVFQGELQLSDSPVLGNWRLHVKVNDEEVTTKDFEVAEYVLPKFAVTIDAQPDANFKDGKIRATVKATYTFGKIAKGNATVTAEVAPRYRYWGYHGGNPTPAKKVSKSVRVDGKEVVEFDIKEELGLEERSYQRRVKLTASFTEELSGKEANATTDVEIHETRHKMELDKVGGNRIKPGLPYKVLANVKFHDRDMPVTDRHNPIVFNVSYIYDVPRTCKRRVWDDTHWRYPRPVAYKIGVARDGEGEEATTEEITTTTTPEPTTTTAKYEEYACREEKSTQKIVEMFLKNGKAMIELDVPDNTSRIEVKAKYLETSYDHFYVSRAESESDSYLQANLISKPSLNDQVSIEVLTNNEISQFIYQIFGKGNLIEAKTLSFPPTKKHVFTFSSSPAMLPKARVIVYYLTPDGEIISDTTDVEFSSELVNFVDLKLSKETAKPGEDLEISVSTKPNSFVGLLGVDQSVLLLKSGNDIEASEVETEINQYNQATQYNYEWYGDNIPSEYYRYYQDFNDIDVIILTNAKNQYEKPYVPIYYEYNEETDGRPYMVAAERDGVFMAMPQAASFHKTTNRVGMPGPPLSTTQATGHDAGVGFGASSGGISQPAKPIEIRKEFPETWLFDNLQFDSSPNATKVLTKKVPDTITSWIITGFSLDPLTGLGLTKQPTKLNVFQPFFVTTNLPYSMKRGEVVAVPIVVFNYLNSDQNVRVTLFNADHEFEFVEVADDENKLTRKKRALESERTKTVEIKSNEGASLSFMIRPLKVGQMTIKVIAESPEAGDGLVRLLRVEPEGITQYKNEAIFIDLRKEDTFSKEIEIFVPETAIPDSTRIEAEAMGDILGPTIDNLDKLIRMPYGCGEQNMLNFVPNILVLEYLTTLGKLTPAIESKCKKYMEVGYQKELTYKHDDGSYSAFGKSDKSGSTWLTAFVAKSFNQASKFIPVDQEKISHALEFLADVQTENGSFPEVGHVSHTAMQGGASNGIALTAYTLITFLENKQHAEKYKETIEKALKNVVENLETVNDTYSLAVAAYALQLAKHPKRSDFIAKLEAKAQSKNGLKYWKQHEVDKKDEEKDDEPFSIRWRPPVSSVSVEMSAYALQTLLEAGGAEAEAVPVMKWLVTQRNANGGFESTQDTVVGLQALSRLAARIYVAESDLTVTVSSDTHAHAQMSLNAGNALVLQKHELPAGERRFAVKASGRGFSVLQLSYRYNVAEAAKFPRFTLTPKVDTDASSAEFLLLSVCTSFVPDAAASRSNMAVMEVALPSGFTFDPDSKDELLTTERVKKVETKDGDTIVLVYFDDIEEKEICPVFKAYRTHAVAKQKPVPVVIYDYYDNTRHARSFYNPPAVSLCDICQDEAECKDACEVPTVEVVN